ncbi:MAG: peptide chain release factor N(5)-glutamine methyltransferase [Balneolaceae bacterium]|nr:peptide chain release factor N(5)-glutamine methyltransferase [Balneolaceae bacterium]
MASTPVPPTPQEWTVLSMMEWATAYFDSKQVDQPRLSIEWLLADVLDMPRLQLYLHFDRPLSNTERDALREGVKARASHKPLQYITGSTSFMGLEIQLNEHVLIPRPETEELVEHALSHALSQSAKGLHSPTVLDVGSGSGCIALAMKSALPESTVHGLELSEDALAVCRRNSDDLGLPVAWHHGSLAGPTQDAPWAKAHSIDVMLSNPPYIHPEEAPSMDTQVKDWEPAQALFTDDPLGIYNQLWTLASSVLKPTGRLGFECNPSTIREVLDAGVNLGFEGEIVADMQGHERFIFAQRAR